MTAAAPADGLARAAQIELQPAHSLPARQRYLLDFAVRRGGRVLDFGPESNALVQEGLARGLDIYGATSSPVAGGRILPMLAGDLPFPSNYFDAVISDHALSEAEDLNLALKEIRRVLKPGGALVAVCVSHDAIRERRSGAPLAHWLSHRPFLFRRWMALLHRLRVGNDRVGKTAAEWAEGYLEQLTSRCFYRSEEDLRRYFRQAGFRIAHAEADYLHRRWGLPRPLAVAGGLAFRRLAGVVLRAS
jgi:SAM-dependent methyltransferase